jgi:hypothetical protein
MEHGLDAGSGCPARVATSGWRGWRPPARARSRWSRHLGDREWAPLDSHPWDELTYVLEGEMEFTLPDV